MYTKLHLLLTIFSLLFLASLTGQNMVVNGDLESWDNPDTPTAWDLMENVSQEATFVHEGNYAAAHMSAPSSQKFNQVIEGIIGGQQYDISYYFLDNVDNAKTRIWSYWLDSSGETLDDNPDELRPNEYSENSEEWQHFNVILTAPEDAAGFRFEVRVYHQDNNVDGHVYYDDFSVEAVNTNFPEPTNYPENFEATTSGLTISLDWTDATGDQLPGAYLIYGQQGNAGDFPVPEDGLPVANDLNWSDGTVAVNVAYGLETYAFEGLTGGQSYEFIIYPYTNIGENINYKTDGDPPLASASVSNLVIINEEDFEDGTLGTWMQYSVKGPQLWEPYEYQGDIFARISGYEDGAVENEDWLISPELDLSSLQQASFEFISARNYEGEVLQLYISLDYDGSGDPNLFNWTELTDQADWSEGSWEWTASGEIDLSEYLASSCYLAFKYISNTSEASAWEIDNILVFGESGVGITMKEENKLHIFPNPTSGMLNISTEYAGHLEIINLNGHMLIEQELQDGRNTVSVSNLKNGLYFLVVKSKTGKISRGKVLIN